MVGVQVMCVRSAESQVRVTHDGDFALVLQVSQRLVQLLTWYRLKYKHFKLEAFIN